MKFYKILTVLFAAVFLNACGSDDDTCGPMDFAGTYQLDASTVTGGCENVFEESITITAAGDDAISINGGAAISVEGCSAFNSIAGPIGGIADGDQVTIIEGGGIEFRKQTLMTCKAIYN